MGNLFLDKEVSVNCILLKAFLEIVIYSFDIVSDHQQPDLKSIWMLGRLET